MVGVGRVMVLVGGWGKVEVVVVVVNSRWEERREAASSASYTLMF